MRPRDDVFQTPPRNRGIGADKSSQRVILPQH
jgi:hypothetical protein